MLSQNPQQDRLQLIEVNRLMMQLEQGVDYQELSLQDMKLVKKIEFLDADEATQTFLQGEDLKGQNFIIQARYVNHEVVGFYRFLYSIEQVNTQILMNIILLLMFIGCGVLLYYLKISLWKPFEHLHLAAIALSKGNFSVDLQEQRYHAFGKFVWALNVLRDELLISKKRELALEKEKKTMIASISHDMRTPISNIALYSQALAKNLFQDKHQQDICVQRIEENTKKLEAYVQTVIDTSTQNLIQIDVACEDIYIHELMKRIRDDIVEKLHLLHIHYTCDGNVDGLITTDIEKSMEVINNLFDNAIKYGDGKEISLYLRKEQKSLFIAITNSGDVLKEGEREYIFQSFYRGSNIADKSGNGLGLYICKQIMEAMKGNIWLESNVDCTCFVLRFPCA